MIKKDAVVRVTKGRHYYKTGVVTEVFGAGELSVERVFTISFSNHHSGQFKESELMEIAQGGEIL